ncbi:MAG TPA: GNAT family protein [Tepidisphaeraceae bacterium]|nr:GNAT family protein [Tepidisphaeraceae bacterium]
MLLASVDEQTELRVLSESDAPVFYEVLRANREHLSRWFDFAEREQSMEEVVAFLKRTQERYTRRSGFWCGIWQDGDLIGAIGVSNFDGENRSIELSYWLAKSQTGKGICTRACAAMIDYLFKEYGLNRVGIRCAAENQRSAALAARLGFRMEGLLRQAERFDGRFRDVAVYGLLADEWVPRGQETQ